MKISSVSDYFKEKVVLITGSSGGIGKALAISLLKSGSYVILNGTNQNKLDKTFLELKKIAKYVHQVSCDISVIEEAERLVNECIEVFGKLDIVINNAGLSMGGQFDELDLKAFKKVIDVNLLGSAYISKFALPHLRKQEGSLIFTSSIAGIHGLPFFAPYSVSKMGLRAMAESLRIEEYKTNVHVGLMFIGFTENDPEKRSFNSSGKLIELKERKGLKKQSQELVSQLIMTKIKKRKFISFLNPMGKVTMLVNRFFPFLLHFILRKSLKRIKQLS